MFNKLGSRKMAISLAVIGVAALMDGVTKLGLSDNLRALLEFVAGAYIVGNVGEHVSRAAVARKQASATTPMDMSPVTQEIAQLRQEHSATQQGVATIQQFLANAFQRLG